MWWTRCSTRWTCCGVWGGPVGVCDESVVAPGGPVVVSGVDLLECLVDLL